MDQRWQNLSATSQGRTVVLCRTERYVSGPRYARPIGPTNPTIIMAARPRIRRRANWPENLHEPRPGYYTWRDPRDGKTHVLGRMPLAQAIHEAQQANLVVENGKATSTLAERVQKE